MKKSSLQLLYDDHCPLCAAYTQAFVTTGILAKEGRVQWSKISPETWQQLDAEKARNEIPLIDPATGKIWYGIDALLELLGRRCSLIQTLGKWKPLNMALKLLYSFISYNRRVIVAVGNPPGEADGGPTFQFLYRSVFLLFGLLINTLLLIPLANDVLHHNIMSPIPMWQWQMGHGVVVVIDIALAFALPYRKAMEYLGQINMLALIVLLLFVPLMWMGANFLGRHPVLLYGWMGLVTLVFGREYKRRMTYAGIWPNQKLIVFGNGLTLLVGIALLLFR